MHGGLISMSFSTEPQVASAVRVDILPPSVVDTFEFEYAAGGVTPVAPGTTGPRTVPQAVVVNIRGTEALITDANNKAYAVPDGAAFCIPAGQRHEITVIDRRGVSLWSHVLMRVLGSVDFLALFEPALPLTGQRSSLIGDLNAKLADASQEFPDFACRLEMEGYGRLLGAALTRDAAPSKRP
jgi:hypothetical protein